MPFNEELPDWKKNNPDPTPTQDKKDRGWVAGERPPASMWNWFANRTYRALKQLFDNAIHKETLGKPNGPAQLGANGKLLPGQENEQAINDASTEQKGIVQLDDNTNSTSITKAATANALNKLRLLISNVQNYGIATKAEAETGTSNFKYMTPLRVFEAIKKLVQKNVPDGYAGLGPDGLLLDSLFPTNTSKALYGQYIGDGVQGRFIPLGFAPKIMFIIRRDNNYGIISYSFINDLGFVMNYIGGQATQYSGKTQRIEGQNIIAGSNSNNGLNAAGVVFEYMAFV